MGIQNQGSKYKTYLYKKSNCNLNSRSKTCSGASQLLTKSGILKLKNKIPKTNYYVDNGKTKRDLSVETDKCILRGYYKRKFGRFKCSVNTPDEGTIAEPKRDHNSCGDSIPEKQNEKIRLHIDVTSLVVENLKDLLNDWIKKYLLNDNETKQKIETVFDSILHNLELQRPSSSFTYTLDNKVDEKKPLNSRDAKAAKFVTCGKQSCQTVPITGKYIKLISTLSIPRKIKRHASNHSQHLKHTTRNIRYKNVFLTISRSSTFLLNSSSFNLLSISTKSFIKRCATYDSKEIKTSKKHEVVLVPKSSYSESMPHIGYHEKVELGLERKVYPNALEIEPVQSLVKSIYANDPANITISDRNVHRCKHDNYTMTDTDCTLNHVESTNQRHKLNWKKATDTAYHDSPKAGNKRKKNIKSRTISPGYIIRKTKSKKKHMPSFKSLNKKTTDTSNLYKKLNSNHNENGLLKDLQDVLNRFNNYTDSKNIKFDVRINVFQGSANKINDEVNNEKNIKNTIHDDKFTAAYNVISTQILPKPKTSDPIMKSQSTSSNYSQKSQPKLISILDGAISQSNYVISKERSYESSDKNTKTGNVKIEPTNISPELEIAKDISELRIIIRDLATTTEKFVREHLEHLKRESDIKEKNINTNSNLSKDHFKLSTISKAVQYPNNKSQMMSGLKLKKEPKKKDIQEFSSGLSKKSISYNVIESESILKVTDMISLAAEVSTDMSINKALKCSIPKSKSLFDITVGHSKRKLLAYYCDEIIKSRQFVHNRNRCCSPNTCTNACPYANEDYSRFINEKECHENNVISCEDHKEPCVEENCDILGPGYSCSSVYIDVENRKKFAVRSHSKMSFWEGLIYCILLWIPVIIIFWLIYVYVIKDIIQPVNPAIGRTISSSHRSSNNSLFHITLSDLGF